MTRPPIDAAAPPPLGGGGVTPSHGGSGWDYARGCRCDSCTTAHRNRIAQRKEERAAARVLISGRLTAPLPAEDHGTDSTYNNWVCRCEPCTTAHARVAAAYQSRRRGAS